MKKIITTKTSINGIDDKSIINQMEAALITHTNQQIIDIAATLPTVAHGKLIKLIFTGQAAEKIDALLKESGLAVDQLMGALSTIIVGIANKPVHTDTSMAQWLSASKRKPREGQDIFYSNIYTSLKEKKVGLCEASTGAGKTAAILAAISDSIKETLQRGVIATPAMALVRDFAIEHARLGKNAPPLRIFFGMGEFVSETELTAFITSWTGFDQQIIAIKKWLSQGAPSRETGIKHRYLKHSLRLISPDIPLDDVLLQDADDETDEGMLEYRKQFNKDHNHEGQAEILLCSHAMLAVDLRTRLAIAARSGNLVESRENLNNAWDLVKANKQEKIDTSDALAIAKVAQAQWDQTVIESSAGQGKLPDYAYVVIDEAHLLEQSFSNSLSNYVAIHQFTLHAKELARQGLLLKGSLADIDKAYHSLCNAAKRQGDDTIHISKLNTDVLSPLAALETAGKVGLNKITKKRLETLPPEQLQSLKRFKTDLACIGQAARTNAGQISYLNLSPRLAYPRLFVGRSSVDQYLRFLWSSVEGAACVSATLYLPKEEGISSWYMQSILAIPEDRKMDFEPVVPKWISDTIKMVYMPSCEHENGKIKLLPPSRGEKLTDIQKEQHDIIWCKEVADKIVSIYDTAAGGCLVLMTSYSYVSKVKSFLMQHPQIADNLIYAQQGEIATKDKPKTQPITIDEQRRKYLQLAFEGKKPIWLALGNAWTGINLSGGDPMKELCGAEIPEHEDNVLTDLVIPRLPFGVNKSVTHAHRVAHKKKVQWERIDTLLRIRQGAGRLVRRHGVPKNRRIHILDARLCEGILAGMMTSVKKALNIKN